MSGANGADFRKEVFSKAVNRFVGVNLKDHGNLPPFSQTRTLNSFAIYLIHRIDDVKWQ